MALPVVLIQAPTLEAGLVLSHRDFALCAMMGVVQVGCGLTLFTIGSFEYPFAGQAKIQPDAFEEVLRSFEQD